MSGISTTPDLNRSESMSGISTRPDLIGSESWNPIFHVLSRPCTATVFFKDQKR